MKNFCFFICCLMLPCLAWAQDEIGDFDDEYVKPPSQVSDSIIVAFQKDFSNAKCEFIQLMEGDDVDVRYQHYINDSGQLVSDSLYCDTDGNYKYCRISVMGDLVMAEYFSGIYSDLQMEDQWTYYYNKGRLIQTINLHSRISLDMVDDYGQYEYLEEKRVIFDPVSKYPLYITREGEGYSSKFSINDVPFEQLDVRRLIYDKYMFETVGSKILNHDMDI